MLDRSHFQSLDEFDPLRHMWDRFALPADVVYLDGNSLGPLPVHVSAAVEKVVEEEWGRDLIRSWNANGWWEMSQRVGERITRLIGVTSGSVVAGDTTTLAIYKAATAARHLRPDRGVILTDRGNFPTDLYALRSVADATGAELSVVEPEMVADALDETVAVLSLTHVDYRTGRRHPMRELTAAAERVGAVSVWDLCHSAGAMDLDLSAADFAVGCGYKYLNGGPGAPAFTYVNPAHHGSLSNPIAGWWAHVDPFAMEPGFRPAPGITAMQTGTQPILSLAALESALEVFEGVEPSALRAKSERLVEDFVRCVEQELEGFEIITPRDPAERGSQVSLEHPEATGIMTALIARGVIGDVRPPHLLRFGLAPVFQRHTDVWDAIQAIRGVMETEAWKDAPIRTGPVI